MRSDFSKKLTLVAKASSRSSRVVGAKVCSVKHREAGLVFVGENRVEGDHNLKAGESRVFRVLRKQPSNCVGQIFFCVGVIEGNSEKFVSRILLSHFFASPLYFAQFFDSYLIVV